MSDVTRILSMIESGDQQASGELLPLVYEELRKLAAARMANERGDHTLQATALVHEAYVRLVDTETVKNWEVSQDTLRLQQVSQTPTRATPSVMFLEICSRAMHPHLQ